MHSVFYWIGFYASMYSLDPRLVASVVHTESGFNSAAVGTKGEIGLMQLRPEYVDAKPQSLFIPQVNIYYGAKKLSEAKKECKHRKEYQWLVCYNMGIAGGSKIKHPDKNGYYQRVMATYRSWH